MGRWGCQWHSLRRVTTAIKKNIPSKCISIFIPLPPKSQKECFYWDEVSTLLEVILPSRTCLLMDGSIASVLLLKFDCNFKDFPFSLPLKPGGIIRPFTKDEVLHNCKQLVQMKRAGEGWEDMNFGLLLNNYSVAWMHRPESFDNKPHQSALAHYCNALSAHNKCGNVVLVHVLHGISDKIVRKRNFQAPLPNVSAWPPYPGVLPYLNANFGIFHQ